MNILFVSTWFPYPLDNGSRLRVYHLLNALVEKHNVHLASFVPPSSNFSENNLQDFHLDKVVTVNHDPFHRDKRKKYLAHFSLTPRDVILSYSVEMESVLQK